MNITAKSRYALKIMMDLAVHYAQGRQKRVDIARRQSISIDFMDQIVARLRGAGMIHSTRGPHGGFILDRLPEEISLWDIFSAVEDSVYPVLCLDKHACCFEDNCIAAGPWQEVYEVVRKGLTDRRLSDLVERWAQDVQSFKIPRYPSVQECRGPTPKLRGHYEG